MNEKPKVPEKLHKYDHDTLAELYGKGARRDTTAYSVWCLIKSVIGYVLACFTRLDGLIDCVEWLMAQGGGYCVGWRTNNDHIDDILGRLEKLEKSGVYAPWIAAAMDPKVDEAIRELAGKPGTVEVVKGMEVIGKEKTGSHGQILDKEVAVTMVRCECGHVHRVPKGCSCGRVVGERTEK